MLATLVFVTLTQTQPIKPSTIFSNRFQSSATLAADAKETLESLPWNDSYREIAWTAFKNSDRHTELRAEFKAKSIRTDDRVSPFLYRIVGTPKPGQSMPMVIALHGGGGAPKAVNDQQWQGMFERYYIDAPDFAPYVYCALRAPNDEWNGFYDDSIAQVVERLILAFAIEGLVDPNRVVTTGASHGGYGNFVIAPKIPHRFSAANASASAPTDGETQGENLRNLYFTWVIGSEDKAFGRPERCQAFAKSWDEWKAEHGGFQGGMNWLEGVGHSVPDREKPAELLRQSRNLSPEKLIWNQTDSRVNTHYFLHDPEPKSGRRITLQLAGKSFIIVNPDAERLVLYPPADIVLKEMVMIWGKASSTVRPVASAENYAESLLLYGDPKLASPYKIEIFNDGATN